MGVRALLRKAHGLAATVAVLAALAPLGSRAQTTPELKQQFDTLFAQTIRNPSDLDTAFKFAEAATRIGDYEAAIGALERMLFFNPNLPRVRLELGILYMRLGSHEMAKSYFTTALAAPDVPADVRDRVNAFLIEIDRRAQPNQVSVFGQTGVRYQTNANASPATTFVKALGQDAILERRFTSQPDWNTFGLMGFKWIADLGSQNGDVLETNFYSYYARQFDVGRFNLGFVEANMGPRFALWPAALQGVTFRPYILANKVWLGDNPYLWTGGAGASLGFTLWNVTVEPAVEYRNRNFRRSFDFQTAAQQTGELVIFAVTSTGQLTPNLGFRTRSTYAINDTTLGFNSYRQSTYDVYLPWTFEVAVPSMNYSRRWTLTPTVGVAHTVYEQPNPIIDPLQKRFDLEWHGGATVDIPINSWLGLGLQAFYIYNNSKLRNYDLRDFIISGGPTFRF